MYKSGHWDHYKKNMFPKWNGDGGQSFSFFVDELPASYDDLCKQEDIPGDLPIRIGEIAHDFRYETAER